ncbi:MAG TPA: 16S rRNA (guanine(527)-N(7))-methyltransferase RsmG [Defluviitaleaceae bacterium]|jgi:16S rRNA (guanine527-N7)-methyltransferase|nr:16S rRNA (guanine(527)-N(7))-methyltransferase RsmG [Candidatus Epulonipiscium sp.]HOQ15847.1 16S rRNA (guanine(527)-N(7))-methyltransferase RsmG [Defluviitaleaceae bacterium]HPT76083.1 16S rRNA (guanine(527)-N(7))-methyltransferase RsmG [Defluviitaleaceae bacterium]HQD50027.1 16S rRNA (guanine(527)-N(7))-methyltransferase RsmG [Defluviitaleaceae bacterium]
MELKDYLIEGSKQLGVHLEDYQTEQFFQFKDLLLEWNNKINLTAIVDDKEIIIKHFLDCLSIGQFFDCQTACNVIDVGTGAGFPGIPLKIAYPNLKTTLLDSLNKRISFLKEVVLNLQLKDVTCIHGRAEELGQNKEYRELYDLCVSRAVAHLSVLSEYTLPFIKTGGTLIAMKGLNVDEELNESKKAIEVLGGEIIDIKDVVIPFSDIKHRLIMIKKVRLTPTKYPRKAGKPGRNPIK